MPPRRVAFAVALLIVALNTRRGEADLIPWSYAWNAHPVVIDADPLGPGSRPTGGITLTPGAISITGGTPGVALGNANIVAVNLTAFTFSPSPDGKPYHFTNSPYHLGVTLTDVASNASGTLTFAGVFNGTLTDSMVDLYHPVQFAHPAMADPRTQRLHGEADSLHAPRTAHERGGREYQCPGERATRSRTVHLAPGCNGICLHHPRLVAATHRLFAANENKSRLCLPFGVG